ncbi:MAG: aminoacyl-tRNA hydrolase [Bdellovibrionaceae bacterium]|nr:aminoacyl-tRNA hydrolase [Pseudobdellovibrionaceae bacterium]MDW8190743.1 aminoacyl-tRNA hydrolase [Pseudobdellovibrionaceae bacterium]
MQGGREDQWLIVGLGNPGKKYAQTRHNVGFLFIDWLVQRIEKGLVPLVSRVHGPQKKFHSELWQGQSDVGVIFFMKPLTFMNLSGESVSSFVQFYRLSLDHLLVVHDEVDLPFGSCRLVFQRGHGGQNGVRDIHSRLNSNAYYRLRIGIGRPPIHEGSDMELAHWVLSEWSTEEQNQLANIFQRAIEGVGLWLREGYPKAATFLNSQK